MLTVLDDRGVVQYRSVDLENTWASLREVTRRRSSAPPAGGIDAEGLDGVERLDVAEPLVFRGQATGSRVTLGIPLAPYRNAMNAALRRNLGFLGIGAAVCFLMAWLVAEALFLREVRPILATARRVSSGDLEARTGLAHWSRRIP